MKKLKADTLVRKLISNKISKEEFDEFLDGLEDKQMVVYLELSLKNHFDSIMEEHAEKVAFPGNMPKVD